MIIELTNYLLKSIRIHIHYEISDTLPSQSGKRTVLGTLFKGVQTYVAKEN